MPIPVLLLLFFDSVLLSETCGIGELLLFLQSKFALTPHSLFHAFPILRFPLSFSSSTGCDIQLVVFDSQVLFQGLSLAQPEPLRCIARNFEILW